jgi:hypothetical protein
MTGRTLADDVRDVHEADQVDEIDHHAGVLAIGVLALAERVEALPASALRSRLRRHLRLVAVELGRAGTAVTIWKQLTRGKPS